MQNGTFIYTVQRNLRAATTWKDNILLICDDIQIHFYDVTEGKSIIAFKYIHQSHAIGIKKHNQTLFTIQQKIGKCHIYHVINNQSIQIKLLKTYEIGQFGFTKVAYLQKMYTIQGKIMTLNQQLSLFSIDSQNSKICHFKAFNGQKLQYYLYQEEINIQLNYLSAFKYENKFHLLACQEGCKLKKIQLNNENQSQHQISNINEIVLPSSKQIKIILCLQYLQHFRVAVTVREQSISIVNWKTMNIISNITTNPPSRFTILENNTNKQVQQSMFLISKYQINKYNFITKKVAKIARIIEDKVIQSKSKGVMIQQIYYNGQNLIGFTDNFKLFYIDI